MLGNVGLQMNRNKFSLFFWPIFLSLEFGLFYMLIFYATKPSPISNSNFFEISVVGFYMLAIGGVGASVLASLLFLVSTATNGFVIRPKRLAMLVSFIILCVVFLCLIENFSYTVFGLGLKNTDTAWLKITFLLTSLAMAWLLVRSIMAMTGWLLANAPRIAIVMVLISLLGFTQAWVRDSGHALASDTHKDAYNVLILSSDGISARHIPLYGYERNTTPFLVSKSDEFTIFDNAFTNSGNTTGSITAILTGMSPIHTEVVYPPDMLNGRDAPRSLPRILESYGYYRGFWGVPYYADPQTQNILGAFDYSNGEDQRTYLGEILPYNLGLARWLVLAVREDAKGVVDDALFVKEMDNPFDEVSRGHRGMSDARRMEGVLSDIANHDRFFVYVHFMNSHGPWFGVESRHFSQDKEPQGEWDDDWYDDAILDFDRRIRHVYELLEKKGKLSRTLLIVLSDHAEKWSARHRIPLLVRFPRASPGKRIFKNVQAIDIAPTVLATNDIGIPDWMHGLPLTDIHNIPEDRIFFAPYLLHATNVPGQGWRREGGPGIGTNHEITAIFCDHYFVFRFPLNLYSSGKIDGGHQVCSIQPEEALQGVERELRARLETQ
jgi:hypothetical protein